MAEMCETCQLSNSTNTRLVLPDDQRGGGGAGFPNVDLQTGYLTQSLLCIPIRFEGHTVAVAQLVNKLQGGRTVPFTQQDVDNFLHFAGYAAASLARLAPRWALSGSLPSTPNQAPAERTPGGAAGDLAAQHAALPARPRRAPPRGVHAVHDVHARRGDARPAGAGAPRHDVRAGPHALRPLLGVHRGRAAAPARGPPRGGAPGVAAGGRRYPRPGIGRAPAALPFPWRSSVEFLEFEPPLWFEARFLCYSFCSRPQKFGSRTENFVVEPHLGGQICK